MFVVLIRTVVLYLFIIVGIRLLGKHQIGQLEPSELVLTLIIADLASVPMQDNGIPLLAGLIPIVVLLAMSSTLSVLCIKSLRFRALLCGKPSIVVENGKVSTCGRCVEVEGPCGQCGYFFVAEYTLLFRGNIKIILEMLRTYLKYL